ncbi:hypothetical protein EP47_04850 [Legionella norrlandica]|uniref:Flagellar basal-body rod protein FlgF n=1 Tax=Legionella norrlandica TaxID=1498499 RepID=A0A0A2SW63_9GAMM|nr:flagellar basal body rod protein FlgF [Legionella norrlandica]KGP63694.1 hypothetical protein EP47_04850 [Legionella norrlandica]
MLEHSLYVNANGGKQIVTNMQVIANNLANISTTAFRADYKNVVNTDSIKNEDRKRVIQNNLIYTDPKPGAINYTGRNLDIAIDGINGYLAVQTQSGQLGYTRAGSLDITSQGLLVTSKGDIVLGTTGVITVPPSSKVTIDKNGVVYAQLPGEPATTLSEVGKINLVEAEPANMKKGNDGLFYPNGNFLPTPAVNIKLIPESLEGSNVDPIRCLTELIESSRQFDIHTKLMREASENATKSNQLLNITT